MKSSSSSFNNFPLETRLFPFVWKLCGKESNSALPGRPDRSVLKLDAKAVGVGLVSLALFMDESRSVFPFWPARAREFPTYIIGKMRVHSPIFLISISKGGTACLWPARPGDRKRSIIISYLLLYHRLQSLPLAVP